MRVIDNYYSDQLLRANELLSARFGEAQDAIQRVRELHAPIVRRGRTYCAHCPDVYQPREFNAEYPCQTIEALDGNHE